MTRAGPLAGPGGASWLRLAAAVPRRRRRQRRRDWRPRSSGRCCCRCVATQRGGPTGALRPSAQPSAAGGRQGGVSLGCRSRSASGAALGVLRALVSWRPRGVRLALGRRNRQKKRKRKRMRREKEKKAEVVCGYPGEDAFGALLGYGPPFVGLLGPDAEPSRWASSASCVQGQGAPRRGGVSGWGVGGGLPGLA